MALLGREIARVGWATVDECGIQVVFFPIWYTIKGSPALRDVMGEDEECCGLSSSGPVAVSQALFMCGVELFPAFCAT
jgi:hypothetical protein